MERNQTNKWLACIISTLAEVDGAPAGHVYMALMADGCSHGDFMQLQTILVSGGICTLAGNVLALTAAGKEMAVEINAAIAA